MKKVLFVVMMVTSVATSAADSDNSDLSKLAEMFAWWNQAMASETGPTETGFRQHFNENAAIVINGKEVVRGTGAMAKYFNAIKSRTEFIEIKIPFQKEFKSGSNIFTHHEIHAIRGGEESRDIAMGYAVVENGRLSLVSLIRHQVR